MMSRQEASDQYRKALREGQREYRERAMAGLDPYPQVLDDLLQMATVTEQTVGLVEIPVEQIAGMKSAGRITAFTAGFLPLLDMNSEFATKWINLCQAHLTEEGIREPVSCYEYLGNFYIQEGNKRVSVLKHFGAARIPAMVIRLLPRRDDSPRMRAYGEFLDFYKATKIYEVQYQKPGRYAKLLAAMGKEPGEPWEERERRGFTAYLQYFRDAFYTLGGKNLKLRPEDALLVWLRVYPFRDLGRLSAGELKKKLEALWEDVLTMAEPEPVAVHTEPAAVESPGLLRKLMGLDHITAAFVHQRDEQTSPWTHAHEEGRRHLERVLGEQVTTKAYFHADTQSQADTLLEQAVEDGADVIFTTTPQLNSASLRIAVKYPKVRVLNCSVDSPYSSIRTYYCRVYEGKFITGAIAGAMAENDRIGYVGSYPIFGVPASINAFALGAKMTNPRANIELRWSCQKGDWVKEFQRLGIGVISNRDVPTSEQKYLGYGDYGIFLVDQEGLVPLGSPCWMWGRFYEHVLRSILAGAWNMDKVWPRAVNYWWGMDSGVIDLKLSPCVPKGVALLAKTLARQLREGSLDPFRQVIVAQDGTVKNDGSHSFSPDQVLHMDWLCDNVTGSIPAFEDLEPFAQPMVRLLGVYRDKIVQEKEVVGDADFGGVR